MTLPPVVYASQGAPRMGRHARYEVSDTNYALLRHLPRRGPLRASGDDLLDVRGHQGLAVVAEGVVDHTALAVVLDEDQRLGHLAPVGVSGHEHLDLGVALELRVQLVIDREVGQTRSDGMLLVGDLRLELGARAVAGGAHHPLAAAQLAELLPLRE